MALTFSGGIDLQKSGKAPAGKIKYFGNPAYTVVDFSQERGVTFTPSVSVGDRVARYGQIGEQIYKGEEIPVYSGVSGVVSALPRREDGSVYAAVIDCDGEDRRAELKTYTGTLENLIPDLAIELIKHAGITCRGAHKFAYRKIAAANGETLRFFLNCCESEPGVTCRKALLNEDTDAVLMGAKILMRALDCRKCEIIIEKNSGELIDRLKSLTRRDPLFDVRKVKPKFPQDEELSVICAAHGARLSDASKPEKTHCAVFDAEVAAAVYRAVAFGVPECERVVTVEPENVLCPIGTPASELLNYVGVSTDNARHVILGGIMRGKLCRSEDEPIKADTEAITVVYHGDGRHIPEMTECTRCGRCVSVCPSGLMPYYIAEMSRKKKYRVCAEYGAAACTECGCCDYVCPAYIPVKKLIRAAKQKISEQKPKPGPAEEELKATETAPETAEETQITAETAPELEITPENPAEESENEQVFVSEPETAEKEQSEQEIPEEQTEK